MSSAEPQVLVARAALEALLDEAPKDQQDAVRDQERDQETVRDKAHDDDKDD